MSDGNRWNRTGHIALGIAAALVPGLDWYAAQREIDQCPMENDRYPARPIVPVEGSDWVEYWAAPRVLDSLHDTREVAIGKEIGRWVAWAWSAAVAVAVVTQAWPWAWALIGAWLGLCAVGWLLVLVVDA